MAVVKMNKITLLGLVKERSSLLESLMSLGVVEINQEEPDEEIKGKAHNPQVQSELNKMDSSLSELTRAIEIINRYVPVKKPMFSTRRTVTEADYLAVMRHRDEILQNAYRINRSEDEVIKNKGEENRTKSLIESLKPWLELDIPVDIANTRNTFCMTGSLNGAIDLNNIEEALTEAFPEAILLRGKSTKEYHYVAIIAHNSVESEITTRLRDWNWNRIQLKDTRGTSRESLEHLEKRLSAINKEREDKISAIKELATERERLEVVSDGFRMERARIEAKSQMVTTKSVFVLKGWVPKELSSKVKEYLTKNYFCSVEIEEPAKDETFPVLIENGSFVESISPVLKMYGVPSSRELDPSPVMMPFFIFFFGLMLGDGGYGIIMALATGFILWKVKLEDHTRRFIKLIFFCGLATIVAGLLTGSWFGISAFAKTALWIVPTENPELMMSWAILFGIIHMYIGLFIKGLNLIRRGLIWDAIFDVLFIYILFTGFILSLITFAPGIDTSNLGGVVKVGNYLFIIGVILTVATQGRNSKSVFGKVFGGVGKLYDVIGFFSDCLSYTRLVALGLASSIIGDIVNTMSSSFGGNPVFGFIAGGLIVIIGHVINFGLNVLGAYVHSCRLQFLEFFGKFFEGGGEPFRPFKSDTKHIIVKTDVLKFLQSRASSEVA